MMKLMKFTIIFMCLFVMGNTQPSQRLKKKYRRIEAARYHPNLTTADFRNHSSKDITLDDRDEDPIEEQPENAVEYDSPFYDLLDEDELEELPEEPVEYGSAFYDLLDDDPIEEQQEGKSEDESPFIQSNVCLQPAKKGLCLAAIPSFWYNSISKDCEKFIYGGCFGNGNNFWSYKDCMAFCHDGILLEKDI